MKTIKIALLGFMILAVSSLSAQEKQQANQEARKAKRVAIITEKLALTEAESKAFWPVYDELKREHKALRKNFKKTREKGKKMEELNDQEVEKILNDSFDFKQKELDLKKRYHIKLKNVLPIKKIAKLYHLERRMNKEMGPRKRTRPSPQHR